MLGGGCWCFTMLWIALTLPYLLLAVSVTRNWINALSLSHTHSNPRKHSDALVRAESMCNSHTALQSRTPAKLSSPCLSGLFFSRRLLWVKPLRGDTGFIFREKACEQPCLLALWVFFSSLAAVTAGILCRVWRLLFVCVPPTPSGVGCSAPATEKSDSLWFIFANSMDQP